MNKKRDIIQIFGILMKNPTLLSKVDKYSLSIADFSTRFEKYIFTAISGLYKQGATNLDVIDIENYLSSNATAKDCFESNNGIEFLMDAKEYSSVENFDYYYNHLKKVSLLESLKKTGFDTSDFYCENPLDVNAEEKNREFEGLTVQNILEKLKRKILTIESSYINNDISKSSNAFEGMRTVINKGYTHENIGLPLQGRIFTEIISGAIKGTLTIRSGGSGLGKTRNMVGDACLLAFPLRYDPKYEEWVRVGSCEKVLYIVTEQSIEEIQRMIMAYLTGINENKIKYGAYSEKEKKVIEQAMIVLEHYQNNFQITQVPNPTNELIKSIVRENCIVNQIEYVFYDYIFIGNALLAEFRGFGLRNDELLLLLSTTLKDLAVEQNIFIMTATQVNANADDNKNIRNESSLAGGRATINKADNGFIMSRPTKEEIDALEPYINSYHIIPNLVTDVFKVRGGEWTQVRIWSYFDSGVLRKEDLFLTNSRLEGIDTGSIYNFEYGSIFEEDINSVLLKLNPSNIYSMTAESERKVISLKNLL